MLTINRSTLSNFHVAAAHLQINVSAINASAINTGKLQNLKVAMEGIHTGAITNAGVRFQEQAFGSVVSGGAKSPFGDMTSFASRHSRNPLDNQASPMKTGAREMQSDEGWWDKVKEFFGSVAGSVVSGAGTSTPAGEAGGATGGSVAGSAWTILTANTGSPEEKKNEANGIFGIFRQGTTGTSNGNASSQLNSVLDEDAALFSPGGNKGEPLPDSPTGSSSNPKFVTPGMIDALKATNRSKAEPVDDGGGSSYGGPVNTGANGLGHLGSLSMPVDGYGSVSTAGYVLSKIDIKALQARIQANITLVR